MKKRIAEKFKNRSAFLCFLGIIVVLAFFFMPKDDLLSGIQSLAFGNGTMLFVGDIMLGRSVERKMEAEGLQYPFEEVSDLLFGAEITVGNFEASVPMEHIPTPNFGFAFSVREMYLAVLKEHGFDVLSLANNHALDYKEAGYENTIASCGEMEIECIGHPVRVDETSTTVVSVGGNRIGLIALHTLFAAPDMDAIDAVLAALKNESDVQIAYVHWGDEYEPEHNTAQERLAHDLIDRGVDAVVGHHPHVVQDIEIYDGKPIFYSLGNFIFDQYWSEETQKGLAIRLHVGKNALTYELIPITMIGSKSQPRVEAKEEAEQIVKALFARSGGVEEYVRNNTLRIPR
jgi:gamma-polyglutamate biosynthesis protein CapA